MRTISERSAARWAPIGSSRVAVARRSCFSVSGRGAVLSRPPAGAARARPAGRAQLVAIERRAVEQVGELLAIRRVVERPLLLPRPRLDLRGEDHGAAPSGPRRYSIASSAAPAMRNPIGWRGASRGGATR